MEAVLSLPPDATPEQLQQAMSVVSWVYGRIGELPENVPLRPLRIPLNTLNEVKSDTSSPPKSNEESSRSPNANNSSSPPGVSSTQSRDQGDSPSSTENIERNSPPVELPDPVYRMVRMTSSIYCRAILHRVPTSTVVDEAELMQVFGLTFRVPMAARKTILGIYLWTLLAISPSCHTAAPARFIKTLFVNGFLTVAVENWHVAVDAFEAALKLQRWLKGSSTKKGMIFGGEGVIEKHGFAVKEVLQNIATVHQPANGEPDDEDEHDVEM